MNEPRSRRRFIAVLAGMPLAFLGLDGRSGTIVAGEVCGHHGRMRPDQAFSHPDPRPGIDASNVLTEDRLIDASAAEVYDMVREIPEVVDGVQCHCGCADLEDHYSLLSCYEGNGMAQFCKICQGQARLVHRLHQDGKSLDAIRTSVDARYG